jgi:hypothetical protein
MNFWKNTHYSYRSLTEFPEEKLLLLVNEMDRNDIIEWLAWNDANGIYHDELSLKEFGYVMTRDEGLEIMIRQLAENRVADSQKK